MDGARNTNLFHKTRQLLERNQRSWEWILDNVDSNPWLNNAGLVFILHNKLELFGDLTRGLEDSGVAPSRALNRGEVPDARRSAQEEVGLKFTPTSSITILA